MSGPRVQVREIEREKLQPQAVPIDTYAPEGESELSQLAEGLAELAPAGRGLAQILQKRQNEGDLAAGRAAVHELREEAKGYKDAIKKGLIDENESPWFRRGAKEQFGRLAADSFGSQLSIATMQRLADSTDPEDFDEVVADVRSEFFEELGEDGEGEAFAAGFNPRAEAHIVNTRASFNQQANARAVNQVVVQTTQEHANTIQQGIDEDLSIQTIAEGINLTNDRNIATGLSGTKLNELTIRAVVDMAESNGDETILDVLEYVRGGPGSTLENHPIALDLVGPARSRINAKKNSELRHQQAQEDRRKREEISAIEGEALEEAIANGPASVDVPARQRQLIDMGAPDAAMNLGRKLNLTIEAALPNDPQLVEDLVRDVWMVEDQDDPDYVDTGRLFNTDLNLEDMKQVQSQMSMRGSLRSGGPAQQWAFKQLNKNLTRIRGAFGGGLMDKFSQVAEDNARAAQYELTESFLILNEMNPEIINDPIKLNKWFADETHRIIEERREESNSYTIGETSKAHLVSRKFWMRYQVIDQGEFDAYHLAWRQADGNLDALPHNVVDALMEFGLETDEDIITFFDTQQQFFDESRF